MKDRSEILSIFMSFNEIKNQSGFQSINAREYFSSELSSFLSPKVVYINPFVLTRYNEIA